MTSRDVIVLPGGMYGPHSPLLMYAADAAERRGATIQPISWDDPAGPLALTPDTRGPWVLDQLARAVPDVQEDTLLIAKSLGTHAAAVAADRNLPAVWLTPVLTSAFVVDGLRRSTAPFLLVGGTADELWDSTLARELTPYVLEVDGADHGMYVPGRLAASAAVLGQTATAVEDFLDQVVWPD
jgi:hypothetical protein